MTRSITSAINRIQSLHHSMLSLTTQNQKLQSSTDHTKSHYHRKKTQSLVIYRLNQNCDQACSYIQMRCDPRALRMVNDCGVISRSFQCDTCSTEFNSFAPAIRNMHSPVLDLLKNSTMIEKVRGGECVVSEYQMLLNCDNSSEKHQRVCACVNINH